MDRQGRVGLLMGVNLGVYHLDLNFEKNAKSQSQFV